MTPDEKLFYAIFGGMTKEQKEKEEANARIAAHELAKKIAAIAQTTLCFGKSKEARWLPCLYYGSSAAVAILDQKNVLLTIDGTCYTTASQMDVEKIDVFNQSL